MERRILLIDLDTGTIVNEYEFDKRFTGVAINPYMNIGALVDNATGELTLIQLPNPVPEITSINPVTVFRGSPTTTLMIEGSGFIKTSTVSSLQVNFIDNHHLEVELPESLLVSAGTYQIIVTNLSPDGGTSNLMDLRIDNPIPTLSRLEPTEAMAGTQGMTLLVHGMGFFNDSTVFINGTSRSFSLIDQTKLQIQLTISDLEKGGYLEVKVSNSSPGGGESNVLTFTVLNPVPSLSSLNPSSIIAGSPDFTLILNGDNFVKTSTVSFNNQSFQSRYISKTQIEATIPASAITTQGSYPVKVINPTPGGRESSSLPFTVKPPLQITGFSPTEGPVGTSVTINGTNFDAGGLRVSYNGSPAVISKFTNSSINTIVPLGADTGPIIVTNALGTTTSVTNFKVTSLYDFSISITPQNVKAAPGGEVYYTISAAGSGGFSSLVALTIQGLPEGFSAFFSPKTITSGQSSTLIISTCNCSLSSPAILNITGSATLEGKTVTRSVSTTLDILTPGTTALIGRVLDTERRPLKNVTIKVGEFFATTDESGNFLLENPPTGDQVVLIDGFSASTQTAKYPTIPITMNIVSGQVNSLPFIPHLHAQKNYNFTFIDPSSETIVEDPELPGFQMRIPAGVQIIGWDGQPNIKVSARRVPIDALPVPPPPPDLQVRTVYMFYFDKQGGGVPDVPIPITLPNDLGLGPGEKADLWYFNESPNINEAPNEWSNAGTGTVSDDGKTIYTDPGVGIPRFCCGAIFWAPRDPTGDSPPPKYCIVGRKSVEPSTGLFIHTETDLSIPGRIPIVIERTYRTRDTFRGPYGIGTYFSYDWYLLSSGSMATLVTPPGTRIYFSRQPDGTYINTSEPTYRGAIVTLSPERILRMKDGTTYKFDGNGLLIEQSDRNGNKLTFLREVEGNVTKIIGTDGRTMVTFNIKIMPRDVITDMTDITGRKVTYTYNYSVDSGTGRLMSVTNPEGGVTSYTYDSQGRMTSIIDPLGNTIVNVSYDVNSRVCQEQYADGGAYKFYYITVNQATTLQALKLLSEAAAGGPITTPICSAVSSNSPIAYTIAVDPNGNITTYRFNNSKKIISVTNANGQTSTSNRDPVTNLIKSLTDVVGRTTNYTYDNSGNITSIIDPAGNMTTMEYDQTLNTPLRITDALGNVTTMTYDSKGNLIQFRNPNNELITINYNQYGQPISITDAIGNTTTSEYDDSGKLIKTTDPFGNSATRQYDPLSRLIESTDARGNKSTYIYDLMNRVAEIKDTSNRSTTFTYDLNGNLLSITDAKGQTIAYTYNANDMVASMKDQMGRIGTYEYDFNDNIIRMTDRKGQVTAYSYDNSNRLNRVNYADGSYTENTYDAVGRLVFINDSTSGPIQYVYSDTGCSTCGGAADKVIQETTLLGSISYTYDALGRRTSMNVAGQPAVNYQYDANSRLLSISTLYSQLGSLNFNISYDGLGRRTSLTYPNGVTTKYTYDNGSQILNLEHLNPLNQILESINYTYDQNGNRTNTNRANVPVKLPDPKSNISYNSANQMLTFNDKSMTYDENGNMISATNTCGTTTYTWDARNRLTAINGFNTDCSQLTANFKYDALGRRVEKTINGRTSQYFYDGLDIVLEIENGVITVNYLRTLNIDEHLARITSDGILRYYQTDALGSIIALTDETGAIKTQYNYDSFGGVTISGETNDNPFQYTGRENDGTGLYYYRARYYSSELQRFISDDPIRFEGGELNFYIYTLNNPLSLIDPFGLFTDHSKFPENDRFSWGDEDSGWTAPYYPWSVSHFRNMDAVEKEITKAITRCNKNSFRRNVHAGQDTFVHWDKGYRPWPFHGWHPRHWGPGHSFSILSRVDPDEDEAARREASKWTEKKVNKWDECCSGR